MAEGERKILEVFKKFDIDGDGTIAKEEMTEALKTIDETLWNDDSVEELYRMVDVDANGRINVKEFVQWVWSTERSGNVVGDVGQVGYTHVDHDGRIPYATLEKKIQTLELEDLRHHTETLNALTDQFKLHWKVGLGAESFIEDTFLRHMLRNCIFVGHTNTDLDSIAGAICAAELFRGQPARSEEDFNGEIDWALKWAGLTVPPVFDSVPGGSTPDASERLRKVCLVDHNEVDQMTPTLKDDSKRMQRIVGLIDHHAIASSFNTPSPLFMDIRPWGSMSTIVFHMYIRNRVPIRKEIARILLCAILSDTLNLKSGTTTPADRFSVALLSSFGEVEDIDELAMQLFTAKTNWIVGLGAYEMVRGDQKNFKVDDVRWSIAVLEVTSLEPVLKIAAEIITQLRVFKYEKGDSVNPDTLEKQHDVNKECHCALLFVVDTVQQSSVALICGGREKYLAQRAFPEATWRKAADGIQAPSAEVVPEETLCDVGGLVSRKLEFMPKCTEALSEGVPDWFFSASFSEQQLNRVLSSESVKPLIHDSVKVIWDEETLVAACFEQW